MIHNISRYLLTLALLITAVAGAWAQTQWTSGSCTVTLSSGTLTVSGSGAMANYINSSDRPWHGNRNDITSVVVESGVTSVGKNAFESFSNLTSVTLPEDFTAIGPYAFSNCTSLQSITIPSTVTSIDEGAFYGCDAMTSVTLPEGLTAIGAVAFSSCSSLTSITIPSTVTSIGSYAFMSSTAISDVNLYANPDNLTWGTTNMDFKKDGSTKCHVLAEHLSTYQTKFNGANVTFVGDLEPLPTPIEVTTDAASKQDLFTEASFTMPASDVTVNYTLVRDMQDETNPVAFSGLPSSGNIIVKKGGDDKYQPAEELNIQLIDPLAAAEAQNIIAADGITIKVLVGEVNGQGAIDYDQDNPITLEAFLADMTPSYYWIKAESTDENSTYDGTVYSSEFTVVEQYDLTVKPANEYSKGKMESVTVGTETVTIDANTGEATKTGVAPDTEVKLKAKRGYIIEKVEAKKGGDAPEYYDQLSAGYNVTINVINSNVWSHNIFGQVGFTSGASGSIWNAMTITKEQAIALAEYKGSTSLVLYDKGEGSDDGYGGKNVLYKFAKSDGTTVDIERGVNIKDNPSILQGYTVYYIPKNAN